MSFFHLTFLTSSSSISRCCLTSSEDEGVWKDWRWQLIESKVFLKIFILVLTLRITWSKLSSFFFGLNTGTSSFTDGLSNLFMKLSEILPGSNPLKPKTWHKKLHILRIWRTDRFVVKALKYLWISTCSGCGSLLEVMQENFIPFGFIALQPHFVSVLRKSVFCYALGIMSSI